MTGLVVVRVIWELKLLTCTAFWQVLVDHVSISSTRMRAHTLFRNTPFLFIVLKPHHPLICGSITSFNVFEKAMRVGLCYSTSLDINLELQR
jgi:hypothetical protein